jgi:hypothetical protein
MKKTPQKKMGRPRKAPQDLRSEQFWVKLTPGELAIVTQAGGDQPSVWAREVLLRAAKRSGSK